VTNAHAGAAIDGRDRRRLERLCFRFSWVSVHALARGYRERGSRGRLARPLGTSERFRFSWVSVHALARGC